MLENFHSMQKHKDWKHSAPGLMGTVSTVPAMQKCQKKPYSSNQEESEPEGFRKWTLPWEQQSPLPVELDPKAGDHIEELGFCSSRMETDSCQEEKWAETWWKETMFWNAMAAELKTEPKTMEEAAQGSSRGSFIANRKGLIWESSECPDPRPCFEDIGSGKSYAI